MTHDTTETHTFVGETGTRAFDGMAGFRIGQQYQLRYTREFEEVRVQLPHGPLTWDRVSIVDGAPLCWPFIISELYFLQIVSLLGSVLTDYAT